MEIILDTASLQHLLRNPQERPGRDSYETALDTPMRKQKLILVLDRVGGLQGEWIETCGEEIIAVLINKWEELRAISFVDTPPKIHHHLTKKLKHLGFNDTIDKLILRLAAKTKDKTVVSDDNDFWDPKSLKERGNRNALVARVCREELGITITLLAPLLRKIS